MVEKGESLFMPSRPVAVAVVFRRDGTKRSVLLVKRVSDDPIGLKWVFPGGKIEGGEGAKRAARRELREETGVVARNAKVIGCRMHPVSRVLVTYVLCEYKSGTAVAKAAESLESAEWVPTHCLGERFDGHLFDKVKVALTASGTSKKAGASKRKQVALAV